MSALSKSDFLSKWALIFADNEFQNITEGTFRTFRQDIADSFLNSKAAPNLAPGNFREVRFLTIADRGPETGVTAEEIISRHLTTPVNLGMFFLVELPVPTLYYLAYDDGTNTTVPAGLRRNMFRTGDQVPGDFVNGMLVAWGSPEAAAANIPLLDPTRRNYPFPFTVKQPVGVRMYFFGTTAPGGPFPAPTSTAGTADWKPESAPIPVVDSFQEITQDQGIDLLDDRQVRRARLYKATFPARTLPTVRPETVVYLTGMDQSTFSGPAQMVDPTNPERTIPVTVDMRSGDIVDIQARLEALAAPITQRDADSSLSGEDDIAAAAAWIGDDRALFFNNSIFLLSEDVAFNEGQVRGNGAAIQPGSFVLAVAGTFFYDTNIQGGTLQINGSCLFANASAAFATTIRFENSGAELTLRDVKAGAGAFAVTAAAGVTGCVIVLQSNTTWPDGLALPAGVTLRDERTGTAKRTGTVLQFDREATYYTASGTFTVDTTTKQEGVTVFAYLGASASAPTIPGADFQLLPGDAYAGGREHLYMFTVGANGKIQYAIKQLP